MKRCKIFWPAVVSRLMAIVGIVFLAVPVGVKLSRITHVPEDLVIWTIMVPCLIGAACGVVAVLVGTVAFALLSARTRMAGRGAALSGVFMGCAVGLAAVAIIFPHVGHAPNGDLRRRCRTNLEQIGLACHTYAADNNGEFPDKLSRLYPSYLGVLDIFSCPIAPDSPRLGECIDEETTYLYAPGHSLSSHPSALLACDKPGNHPDGSAAELYVEGHVEWRAPPFEW